MREKGLQVQCCQVYGPHLYSLVGCEFYISCVWCYKVYLVEPFLLSASDN